MKGKPKEVQTEVQWQMLKTGTATVSIRGTSPMICNTMSEKVKCGLLFPAPKKNQAERARTIKHFPEDEFRASCAQFRGDDNRTRIYVPTTMVKSAIMSAALETEGATKAQIGRLVWVTGDRIELFGIPRLLMSVVRSADMNRTPDIRTRAIIENWCLTFKLQYVTPPINIQSLTALIGTAGIIIGIGDFRQEKGKGSYGQFVISTADEIADIIKAGGRKQQDEALANPVPYDLESERLLAHWKERALAKRGDQKEEPEPENGNGKPAKKSRSRIADLV